MLITTLITTHTASKTEKMKKRKERVFSRNARGCYWDTSKNWWAKKADILTCVSKGEDVSVYNTADGKDVTSSTILRAMVEAEIKAEVIDAPLLFGIIRAFPELAEVVKDKRFGPKTARYRNRGHRGPKKSRGTGFQ